MTVPFDLLPTAYPYTLLISQAVTEAVLLLRMPAAFPAGSSSSPDHQLPGPASIDARDHRG
jgi:hypothetical protein